MINNFIDTDFYDTYNLIQDITNMTNIFNNVVTFVFAAEAIIFSGLVSACSPVTVISIGTQITISIIIASIDVASSIIGSLV